MPKFKQPLSQNPFHQWGLSIGGAANADPEDLVGFLANIVTGYMKDNFGMSVDAPRRYYCGRTLEQQDFPGVEFSFVGHTNWARYLVGVSKTAAVLTVDVVQQGTPSSAMQRLNSAERKGMFFHLRRFAEGHNEPKRR